MANLNRPAHKFLVNSLDQTKFGMYTDSGSIEHFVDKVNGIDIPNDGEMVDPVVVVGYGEPENLETMVLKLFAPYPSDTVDWICELNLTAVPNKAKGGTKNHEELSRSYSGKVDSLNAASGVEITMADKLLAIKDIVKYINHDEQRFVNAGMAYVFHNLNSTSASTIAITLEDGSEHTITSTGATGSLAATLNANTDVNPYMTAYSPSASNNANGDITIILPKLDNPSWYLIEESATTDLLDAYLMLQQEKSNVKITYGGGATTTKWIKVPFYMIEMDADACVNAADDADFTVTVDGTATAINVATNTDDDTKALGAAQAIAYEDTSILKADNYYLSASDVSGVVTVVVFGPKTFAIANTAASDLWAYTVSDFTHKYGTEYKDEVMAHIFPVLPQDAYQMLDKPIPGKRYFKVSVKFFETMGDAISVFDGVTPRTSKVEWFFNEDIMPATVTAATGEYWTDGTNMMADTLTGSEDSNIAQLINKVLPGAIVDADLA